MPLIDLKLVNDVWTLNLSMIQTVGLAVITLFIGTWINKHSKFLQRMCMPAPAVGALPFAFLTAILSYYHILDIKFEGSLQTFFNACLLYYHRFDGFLKGIEKRRYFHYLLLPCLCRVDCSSKYCRYRHCKSIGY